MVRQSEARSNTRRDMFGALNSIASKQLQNQLENIKTRTYEELFDYRYAKNDRGQIQGMEYFGDDATFVIDGQTVTSNNGNSNATRTRTRTDAQGNVKYIDQVTDSKNKQTLDNFKIEKEKLDLFDIFPRQSRGRRF
jgi:hypothetical protein